MGTISDVLTRGHSERSGEEEKPPRFVTKVSVRVGQQRENSLSFRFRMLLQRGTAKHERFPRLEKFSPFVAGELVEPVGVGDLRFSFPRCNSRFAAFISVALAFLKKGFGVRLRFVLVQRRRCHGGTGAGYSFNSRGSTGFLRFIAFDGPCLGS